ncbi:MAG: hypothetical protein HUJ95_05405 [Bacteroidales bacterium]|nr:hypothetical protein [Bacteroidales bacterium]
MERLQDLKGNEVLLCLIPIIPNKNTSAEAEVTALLKAEGKALVGNSAMSEGDKSGGGKAQIIIISEDRYRNNPELYLARLNAVLGHFKSLFARNCMVKRITPSLAKDFLAKHHSLGYCAAGTFYGMFIERPGTSGQVKGEMVAVASFSKPRHWLKNSEQYNSYEFVRYASLPSLRIAGGMGKMLEAFKKDHPDADDIMSYCDLEWSEGDAYRKLGFREEAATPPQTFKIDMTSWERLRCKPEGTTYTNLGSKKYRLSL